MRFQLFKVFWQLCLDFSVVVDELGRAGAKVPRANPDGLPIDDAGDLAFMNKYIAVVEVAVPQRWQEQIFFGWEEVAYHAEVFLQQVNVRFGRLLGVRY